MLTARIWRERGRRYRGEISVCEGCGQRHHPPRRVCEQCGGRTMKPGHMPATGRVLTYTVIRNAPADLADATPYAVAVLEMDDGTRAMAQLTDVRPDALAIGMPVRMEFRRIRQCGEGGVLAYGHKAVPAEPPPA